MSDLLLLQFIIFLLIITVKELFNLLIRLTNFINVISNFLTYAFWRWKHSSTLRNSSLCCNVFGCRRYVIASNNHYYFLLKYFILLHTAVNVQEYAVFVISRYVYLFTMFNATVILNSLISHHFTCFKKNEFFSRKV